MTYQKKDPEHVRKVRMEAIARMRAAKELKRQQQAETPKTDASTRYKTPQERGITTIQINADDAQVLSDMAKAKGVSRRIFIHGIVEALRPAAEARSSTGQSS